MDDGGSVANYYLINTKLDPGSVIDSRMQTGPIVDLQVYPANQPETDNQLWQFVADPRGTRFCLLKSKRGLYVIDVKGGKASVRGTPLQIHVQNESGFDDNQLWEFLPDPAGSGDFFIKSRLGDFAINVKGGSVAPRTPLQLFPQKPPGQAASQLWSFRPSLANSFDPSVTVQPGDAATIRLSGEGFVALARISVSYTLTDSAGGVTASSAPDSISALATPHGAFESAIPTAGTALRDGLTLQASVADGTNRLDVKAQFDSTSNSWRLL